MIKLKEITNLATLVSLQLGLLNTLPLEGKSEIFVNEIENNFYGFIFFKKFYMFYQN
jgi:hypothetical protein